MKNEHESVHDEKRLSDPASLKTVVGDKVQGSNSVSATLWLRDLDQVS